MSCDFLLLLIYTCTFIFHSMPHDAVKTNIYVQMFGIGIAQPFHSLWHGSDMHCQQGQTPRLREDAYTQGRN